MSQLSKQALKVENQTSFPNNNTNYITPAILRDYNVDIIDSMVDEIPFGAYTQSVDTSINALNQFTSSASGLNTGSLLVTASAAGNVITFTKGNASTFNVTVATGSIPDLTSLNQATASLQAFTASANIRLTNLEANTASQQTSIDNLNLHTGSYATTGSNTFVGANTFTSISASSFVSASQFVGDGSKITGITASISMPILDEGVPQGNAVSLNFTGSAIGATVAGGVAIISVSGLDSGSFNAYTASTNADLASIHQTTASLNTNSASVNTSITNLNSTTASLNTSITNLNIATASINTTTASINTSITNLNSTTASLNTSVSNLNISTASLNSATASLYTSASLSLTTASIAAQLMTFRKGDGSTFNLTIPTGSSVYVTGSFGAFSDTTTQSGSANTPYAFKFNTTDIPDGVQLSGSTGLQVGAAGTYNIQFSAQGVQGAGSATANIWFRKNGTNIPNSDTQITLPSNTKLVAAWNIFSTANIGDTFEIIWQSDSSATTWAYTAAGGNAPAIPSIIATVNRVDVGGGTNLVSTSSFNAYTASTNSDLASIHQTTASLNSTTASLLTSASLSVVTASASGNTITFTKGDTTTFNVSVSSTPIDTGSFATTGSNVFTGNQTIYKPEGKLLFQSGSTNTAAVSMTAVGNLQLEVQATQIALLQQNAITLQKPTTINGNTTISGNGIFKQNNVSIDLVKNANYSGSQYNIITEFTDVTTDPTNVFSGYQIVRDSDGLNYASIAVTSYSSEYGGTPTGVIIGGGQTNGSDTAIGFPTNQGIDLWKTTTAKRGLNVTGSTYIQTLTASLANGYVWVGDSTGKTTTVATSSFATNISNLATTGSNTFVGNQTISGSLRVTGSVIGTKVGAYDFDSLFYGSQLGGTISNGTFFGYGSTDYQFILGAYNGSTFDNELKISADSTGITFADFNGSSYPSFLKLNTNTGSNPKPIFTRGLAVTGSFELTGSASGNVVSASITSNTASIDFSKGNYFEVTSSVTPLHLNVTNIKPGTTSTLIISASASSSILFSPNVAQPSGSAYSGSAGSIDILSLVAFNTSKVNVVSTKALI